MKIGHIEKRTETYEKGQKRTETDEKGQKRTRKT